MRVVFVLLEEVMITFELFVDRINVLRVQGLIKLHHYLANLVSILTVFPFPHPSSAPIPATPYFFPSGRRPNVPRPHLTSGPCAARAT